MEILENTQTLLLENRKTLAVDGVINVESFTDEYLEISTKLGTIGVEGTDLKIEELRQDNGKILITGLVSGIFYRETKSSRGFFANMFK